MAGDQVTAIHSALAGEFRSDTSCRASAITCNIKSPDRGFVRWSHMPNLIWCLGCRNGRTVTFSNPFGKCLNRPCIAKNGIFIQIRYHFPERSHQTINPELEMGKRLATRLSQPGLIDMIPLSDNIAVGEVKCPTPWTDRTMCYLPERPMFRLDARESTSTFLTTDSFLPVKPA